MRNSVKTSKIVLAALFALIMGWAPILTGCGNPTGASGGDSGMSYSVEAITPEGEDTESLKFVFADEVNSLTGYDIDIASDGNVTWGLVTGGGKEWYLNVTLVGYAGDIDCTVRVAKTGVSTSPRSVTVQNNSGKIDFTLGAEVGNDGAGKLNITFLGRDVAGLAKSQITISPDTGNSPGAADITGEVDGGEHNFSVPISMTREGSISVRIVHSAVTDEARTAELRKGASIGPGPKITSLTIMDKDGEDFKGRPEVETGATIQLTVAVTPPSAQQQASRRIKWESNAPGRATVDESTGLVTGVAEGRAVITATSMDSPEAHDYVEITVIKQELPKNLTITEANTSGRLTPAGSGYAMELYLGEQFTFRTQLATDSNIPTVDQVVHVDFDSNKGILKSFTASSFKAPGDGSRGREYTIESASKSSALDGEKTVITIIADNILPVSSHSRKTLEVTLKYKAVNRIDFYMKAGGTETPITDGASFGAVNSTKVLVVRPDAPYNSITLSSSGAGITHIGSGPEFTLRKSQEFTGPITITATVKDVYDNQTTGNLVINP